MVGEIMIGWIKRAFVALIPASRWEMWNLQSELLALNGRLHKMEARYGAIDRWQRKEEREEQKEIALQEKKQRLLQVLPDALKELNIPEDKHPMIAHMIMSGSDQIDDAIEKMLGVKFTTADVVQAIGALKPLLGGLGGPSKGGMNKAEAMAWVQS